MKHRYLTLAVLFFFCYLKNPVLAHMHLPGPNQGKILMPGNFHVELVPLSKNKLAIYMLDFALKNPTTTDSKIEIIHTKEENKKKVTEKAQCKAMKDHFLCEWSNKIDLFNEGQLTVSSTRLGVKGLLTGQKLPLKKLEMNKDDKLLK